MMGRDAWWLGLIDTQGSFQISKRGVGSALGVAVKVFRYL